MLGVLKREARSRIICFSSSVNSSPADCSAAFQSAPVIILVFSGAAALYPNYAVASLTGRAAGLWLSAQQVYGNCNRNEVLAFHWSTAEFRISPPDLICNLGG